MHDTYIPLDAVVRMANGKAFVNIPKLLVGKMPWGEPPTAATRATKVGPAPGDVAQLHGTVSPTVGRC